MGSTEEFSRILRRKQASFLCISDLVDDYLGPNLGNLEYPPQLVQDPYTFIRIRKEKKYKLKKQDCKVYRQAILDYASYQDKPGHLAKDKHRLILSLTPSGTEEEKSYRSLSSTPCGSLHSVRSRSQANLIINGHHQGSEQHSNLSERRFTKSPSVSPKHRKKVVSSERMMSKSYSHDLEHSENISTGETPSAVSGDAFLPSPSQPCASTSTPFTDQATPKTSPKNLLFMNGNKNSSDNFSNGLGDPIALTVGGHAVSSNYSPQISKFGDMENRGACSTSRLAMEPGTRLTYESFTSHPQYRNKQARNFSPLTNGQFTNNGNVSDDEDADVVETCDDLNDSLHDHPGAISNSRKASSESCGGKFRSSTKPPIDNRLNSHHVTTLTGSCHDYPSVPTTHQSSGSHPCGSPSSNPCGSHHSNPCGSPNSNPCGTPSNNQQHIPQPLKMPDANNDSSKRELNQRISSLFGKIGGSAFELLDEHRESLGDCVNNEYTLASLFEHKSGSLFFYGIVDTIFWHPSSKTMSLVEFQTTIKTTPSPHYLLQLHCFKEIASKKKICKRIKLYILGLHLEPDGPRLKLWRYKPTGAMPSIKALLFDPKLHTQEKLYSCPEFNFMGRLLGKRGTEVVYEMV